MIFSLKNFWIPAAAVLATALWTYFTSEGMTSGERIVSLRFLLMGTTALFAFATPYALFPDPQLPVNQLANLPAKTLLRHLLRKKLLFILLPSTITATLLLAGNVNGFYLIYALLFIVSLGIYSIFRYLRTGERSQYWKESERGRSMQSTLSSMLKTPVDSGSIPSLIQTILITFIGMITVGAGAAFSASFGVFSEIIPLFSLLLMVLYEGKKIGLRIHSFYYQTNAFFREYFRTGLRGDLEPETIEPGELWWVPGGWRADLIPVMTQLARRYPSARWIYAGHFLIWILALQQPGSQMMSAVWGLFLMMHHLTVFQSATEYVLPAWFARWLAPEPHWMKIRFWMQLRWLLLIVSSLFLQALIFEAPEMAVVIWLLIFYIVTAGLSAWLSIWLVRWRSGMGRHRGTRVGAG